MVNTISEDIFSDIVTQAGARFIRNIREAYYSNHLKEFLIMVGMQDLYPEEKASMWDGSYPTGKIVIVGKSSIGKDKVQGLLKHLGFDDDRYELYLEYDEFKNRNLRSKLQYNSKVRLILAGPMPHSMEGKGDDSSGVVMLENMDGTAKVIRLVDSTGALKITKTNIKETLKTQLESGFLRLE